MKRRTLACTAAVLITITSAAACQPDKTTGSSTPTTATNTSKTHAQNKTVPNFIGMGLQSAQDTAQATGFYSLKSHDSLGHDRMQILDRDWKVCSQTPTAGTTTATDTELDFGAVKVEETCPKQDQKPPSAAGGTMPDFRGKAVKAARGALDSSTSLSVKDASGDDRFILMESNWKVCTQQPAPGAALNGQPVTLTAVKFGESCP